jgi:hypothetical protein
MGNENLHILLGASMGEIDPAMKFWPPGASSALLRFVYERLTRRDKIVPAKRKCHVR